MWREFVKYVSVKFYAMISNTLLIIFKSQWVSMCGMDLIGDLFSINCVHTNIHAHTHTLKILDEGFYTTKATFQYQALDFRNSTIVE